MRIKMNRRSKLASLGDKPNLRVDVTDPVYRNIDITPVLLHRTISLPSLSTIAEDPTTPSQQSDDSIPVYTGQSDVYYMNMDNNNPPFKFYQNSLPWTTGDLTFEPRVTSTSPNEAVTDETSKNMYELLRKEKPLDNHDLGSNVNYLNEAKSGADAENRLDGLAQYKWYSMESEKRPLPDLPAAEGIYEEAVEKRTGCCSHILSTRLGRVGVILLALLGITAVIVCTICGIYFGLTSKARLVVGDYKVMCHHTGWSVWRTNKEARFLPENIDVNLCTHIIYASANISKGVATLDKGFPDDFNDVKLRRPGLKTLLQLGDYGQATSFTQAAATNESRDNFVRRVIQLLRDTGFDGLLVYWEPRPEANEKELFTLFLQDIAKGFEIEGLAASPGNRLILSAIVSGQQYFIDGAYDVKAISRWVDFLILEGYHYNGPWNNYTGLNSPLYSSRSQNEVNATFNQNWTVNYWLKKGAPRNKLILGTALHGVSFTLASPNNHAIGSSSIKEGIASNLTEDGDQIAMFEVCMHLKAGWIGVCDAEQKSCYAYSGNQWVSYENIKTVGLKAEYIRDNRLAGVAAFSLGQDDFSGNFCNNGRFPLLSKIADILL
jgi:chitinase